MAGDQTPLPDFIIAALTAQPQDWTVFTAWIKLVSERLAQRLKFPVRHVAGGDYSAGQSVILNFSNRKPYFPDVDGSVAVTIFFSPRANLFAFDFSSARFTTQHEAGTYPKLLETAPSHIHHAVEISRGLLRENGFIEVEHRWFNHLAPGRLTALDEVPATVFGALFSEIV